jgi:hypothetical protein
MSAFSIIFYGKTVHMTGTSPPGARLDLAVWALVIFWIRRIVT